MRKSILFSLFAFYATVLPAQTIVNTSQDCAKNDRTVDLRSFVSHSGEYVDLGLSVKWATCNVGATTPEGYGDYFAWGETATKAIYNWSTYFDYDEDGRYFWYYNYDYGETVLELYDDAANVNWGGSWRMPTETELEELMDNCTWEWTTQNGINGYKVTSKIEGYTHKFIFLPVGDYWSSSLELGDSEDAYRLSIIWLPEVDYFKASYGASHRYYGFSVRPVLP
jgi:hypothetical protein